MLDQMFTVENFRRIFDSENRKGNDVISLFFPRLKELTFKIRSQTSKLRDLRRESANYSPENFELEKEKLKMLISELKAQKSMEIDKELDRMCGRISQPNFSISLKKGIGPNDKAVYCIGDDPDSFFVVKQIQLNIYKIYGVKQSNRHDLLCQIRDTLDGGFPFQVIRTDVSSFYESVDRDKLIKKLDEDQLLSFTSKKFINQIIKAYQTASGSAKGVPRGVGISAYLAELYLRDVDREIRALEGLVLYCRYVDDIVAIFARPSHHATDCSYSASIKAILNRHGLEQNESKTKEFDLADEPTFDFDYLGYNFIRSDNDKMSLRLLPSEAKLAKIQRRLELCFKEFARRRRYDTRRAFRDLVARIKFLTGNTRLSNSKSNANTGIYYNNDLVSDSKIFAELDAQLKRLVSETCHREMKKRLRSYSFTSGFENRRFHNFGSEQLQRIVSLWKYA